MFKCSKKILKVVYSDMNTHSRPERRGYEQVLYKQHIERIASIKPMIDTSAPHQIPVNNRRERERIWKNKIIEHNNMQLLQRLANTIQKSTIDNTQNKHIQEYSKFKQRLYRNVRLSRLKKITNENLHLLKRIQTVKPAYSVCQMEEDYKRNQEIVKQMCLYP